MELSDGIIGRIQNWEGLRLKAYKCAAGVWTIGYGQTGSVDGVPIGPGMIITEAKADELFRNDTAHRITEVANMLIVPANQDELDALVSLAYNIGLGALRKSDVMKSHNDKSVPRGMVALQFLDHVYAGGKFLKPLMLRRAVEACWYLTGKSLEEIK